MAWDWGIAVARAEVMSKHAKFTASLCSGLGSAVSDEVLSCVHRIVAWTNFEEFANGARMLQLTGARYLRTGSCQDARSEATLLSIIKLAGGFSSTGL